MPRNFMEGVVALELNRKVIRLITSYPVSGLWATHKTPTSDTSDQLENATTEELRKGIIGQSI